MVGRLFVALFFTSSLFAQDEDFLRPGLLKASSTISVSDMLATDQSNYYLSGFLEYYLSDKFSIRGESFVHAGGTDGKSDPINNPAFIKSGARTFFGGQYHFGKRNYDFNVGFMPGISLLNLRNVTPLNEGETTFIIPTMAIQSGVTLYVGKYFNFFANLSYMLTPVNGINEAAVYTEVVNADELVISAGLGFQIQTKK